MSAILFSLLAVLSIMAAPTVQGVCQKAVNFTTQSDLFSNVNQCAYPLQNLNMSCVNASCPSLATSGTCPLNKDGSINTAILASQINQCLSSMSTVCGGGWGPLILPQMGLTVNLVVATATCYIPAGGAVVNGLQSTTVSLSAPSPTTLTVTINAPSPIATSTLTCAITAPLINNVGYPFNATMTKTYKGTATVTLSVNPPTVSQVTTTGSTTNINVNLVPQQPSSAGVFGGLVTSVVSLPSTILTPVINMFASVAADSTDAAAFIPFVATYCGLVYQVLLAKCPSGSG